MNIIKYEKLESTQLEAKRLIEENSALDGTIIVAKNQTNGIGTHGRKWFSEKGKNITCTIILKPNIEVKKIEGITLKIANIIVDTIYKIYNIKLDIKPPNDIVYNNKKIGGILTESKIYNNRVKYLFIGIGLNTNQIEFPKELKDIATSIKNEFNIEIYNEKLMVEIGTGIFFTVKKEESQFSKKESKTIAFFKKG